MTVPRCFELPLTVPVDEALRRHLEAYRRPDRQMAGPGQP